MKIINDDLQKFNSKKTCTATSIISYTNHSKRTPCISLTWILLLPCSSSQYPVGWTSKDHLVWIPTQIMSSCSRLLKDLSTEVLGVSKYRLHSFSEQPGLVFYDPWAKPTSSCVPTLFLYLLSFHCTSLRRAWYHFLYMLGKYFLIWPGMMLTFFAAENIPDSYSAPGPPGILLQSFFLTSLASAWSAAQDYSVPNAELPEIPINSFFILAVS